MNTGRDTYKLWDTLNANGDGKNTYKVIEGKLTDQLTNKLHQIGMKFYMVFWSKPRLGTDLSNVKARQATLAYHKYVIDRWGAFVDIWELMNEQTNVPDAYINTVASFVKGYDPYGHLVTTSYERPDLACIEINAPHRYENEPTISIDRKLASDFRTKKAAYGKPVIYGEYGNKYPPYTNYDPERYRIFVWTAMLNEGALVFWHTGYEKNYKSGAGNMFIGPEERVFSRIFSDFMDDFDALAKPVTVELNPANQIRAHVLAGEKDIAVYLVHAASHDKTLSSAQIALPIPQNNMKGVWINPRTGEKLGNFTMSKGTRPIRIPDFRVDLALRIRSKNAAWIPVARAGLDQTVIDGNDNGRENVILDALASYDPDGKISGYSWRENGTQIAARVKSTVEFSPGVHNITLIVIDNQGNTDSDHVAITVNPADIATITLLSPNGGEIYHPGQAITVVWKSANFTGKVRIHCNHGGTRWDTWIDSTANDGMETTFKLPDAVITKYGETGWKIRVINAHGRYPCDESDAAFTITKNQSESVRTSPGKKRPDH